MAWDQWRLPLGGGSGNAGGSGDEGVVEPQDGEPTDSTQDGGESGNAPTTFTPDMMQAMLDSQANNFRTIMDETNKRHETLMQTLLAPQQGQSEEVKSFSVEEMQKMSEEGDTSQLLKMIEHNNRVVEHKANQRVERMENEGRSRINQLAVSLMQQQTPEYDKYKDKVEEIKNKVGIQGELAADPYINDVLVNAARGMNIEDEVNARLEAALRQRNLSPVDDGTPSSAPQRPGASVGSGDEGNQEPYFTPNQLAALQVTKHDRDTFARMLGYKDGAEYDEFSKRLMGGDLEVIAERKKQLQG